MKRRSDGENKREKKIFHFPENLLKNINFHFSSINYQKALLQMTSWGQDDIPVECHVTSNKLDHFSYTFHFRFKKKYFLFILKLVLHFGNDGRMQVRGGWGEGLGIEFHISSSSSTRAKKFLIVF